jgi:hypothetical protein
LAIVRICPLAAQDGSLVHRSTQQPQLELELAALPVVRRRLHLQLELRPGLGASESALADCRVRAFGQQGEEFVSPGRNAAKSSNAGQSSN